MKKMYCIFKIIIKVIAFFLLSVSSYLFFSYNGPIFKNIILYQGLFIVALLIIVYSIVLDIKKKKGISISVPMRLVFGIGYILISIFIVFSFLNTVLIDYFQPLALYDNVIFISMGGYVLIIILMIIDAFIIFIKGKLYKNTLLVVLSGLLIISTLWTWNKVQGDFAYTNINGEAVHVFESGEAGYEIFRIPTLLVVPKGSNLNGKELNHDIIIAMTEARRNGSLDHGDIDLVSKISIDKGNSWSELQVVRKWENGLGKIGNATPVFDEVNGVIHLVHISGMQGKFDTYNMTSDDGGYTWNEPEMIKCCYVGPGHGIQIKNGEYKGRLVIPAYMSGGSYTLYSDDYGVTWHSGEQMSDGNENEIAELPNGDLIITVRTNQGVSKPHGELFKLFATSTDGGETWSELKEAKDIKEPICMSSIVSYGTKLYYSYPNDHYSRANMTVIQSTDNGSSWKDSIVIHEGPSGYSDLSVNNDGDLYLLFENGSVEYDERITFVRVSNK